jgi:hypothetical protein
MKRIKFGIITMKSFFVIVPILMTVMLILVQCNKDRICTMDYRAITLDLKYPDGQPVLLDSGKVVRLSNNQIMSSWNGVSATGLCLIVDDGMQKELENKKEIMRLTAYLNGEIVCERDVLVGADHCHVKYLGKEPLTHVVYGISNEVRDRKFCELVNVENIRWIFISYNAFRTTMDENLSLEDKLPLIVDWFLSHSCITDVHSNGIYLTSEINGYIAFSFVENEETVNMIMCVKGNEAYFGGFE